MRKELDQSEAKEIILNSDLFNPDFYLSNNADIKAAGVDPIEHYLIFGGFEGRDPSSNFNTKFYFDEYPDVKEKNINPLLHYITIGKKEGRLCLPEKEKSLRGSPLNNINFKYNIESIGKSTYQGKDLGIINVSGWCHSDKTDFIPDVELVIDGEVIKKVNLKTPREDVIIAHGHSSFPNGFSSTYQISENNQVYSIIEKNSNTIMFSSNLSKLKKVNINSGEYESWVAYNKIPIDLKQELLKKMGDLDFDWTTKSYEAIHFSMLEFLSRPDQQENGFNVFGYFSKICGLSLAARAFVDSLLENNDKINLVDYFEPTHKRISNQEELKYSKNYFIALNYKTNIFLIDTQTINYLRSNVPIVFKNKRNIASFWWEFESGFEDRIDILNRLDEVYVFSDFIKNILSQIKNREFKITKIKYPFYKDWVIEEDVLIVKEKYNLHGKFCFFFNFDYASGYKRKNPEAILKALYEEFPNDKDVVFVVKTGNIEGFNEKEKTFKNLIQQYGLNNRVIIIKEAISRNSFMGLLNAMDCYISLHRGEGLGLGILESYALGKPVIATNYGGNTEYMDNPLGFPVPYNLVPANDDYIVYKNVKEWAEPDISYAKIYMREVYNATLSEKSEI